MFVAFISSFGNKVATSSSTDYMRSREKGVPKAYTILATKKYNKNMIHINNYVSTR